ncbi:poly(R)-hydroxyalkanoic acid synthase subunit PhaE [candidate division CSSED10-310 bacterium]|uniref:Poly(3-hydroxyalkanoate) polymerase subunit PhaE n=1 Tax=candidate division CSSED10-310 bacterium TaxID=2855610 RepID=A0ABV6Z1J7_UNCC1
MKLFEFWVPLYKSLTQDVLQSDYAEIFDPEAYKKVIDHTFAFISPQNFQSFYQEISKFIEMIITGGSDASGVMADLLAQNNKLFTELMAGKTDAVLDVYQRITENYKKGLAIVIETSGGKKAEYLKTIQNLIDNYTAYLITATKFQQSLHQTGLNAMDRVFKEVDTIRKKGESLKSYDEFFALWVTTNESLFQTLMSSDDYSKLQGELGGSALKIKIEFQKLLEMMFENFPIARRSEIDELYKTIHDLKQRLRAVEKKVGADTE